MNNAGTVVLGSESSTNLNAQAQSKQKGIETLFCDATDLSGDFKLLRQDGLNIPSLGKA